jgi:MSHA biogenesis protein MshJ
MNANPTTSVGADPTRPSRWAALWTQAAPAARWRTLQRRFDQRQQRERLLMIAAAAALALMAADSVWLGPALKAYKAAHGRQVVAQVALQTAQSDLARLSDQDSQAARARLAELASWRQRLRDGDMALRRHEDTLVGADRMVELLEHLLARHGEVRVRAMRSLGRSDLLAPVPGTAAAPGQASTAEAKPGAPAIAAAPSLYRHGVELVLEGGFADLLSYLQAMEALPQRVLWGSVSLKVEQHPKSVLTLRVYTISRERHWLEI